MYGNAGNNMYGSHNSNFNDPYRNNRDPYNNGQLNNRRDELLNDPYARRDPYANNDPYKHNDPYKDNDPYSRKDPYVQQGGLFNSPLREKEKFSFFWFWLKREMQLLFNAEAGSQEQNLVYPIEEDFMKLRIASKFFIKNIVAFFLILGGFWISLSIIAQFGEKYEQLRFIFGILYVFLILYLLFLPTHQIVSSFEYTVYKNAKEFYKRIATLFSSYRNSVIFAIILNLILGAIAAYEPEWLHFFIKKGNITLEFFKSENVKFAYNLLTFLSVISLIFYIMFYKVVFKTAQNNKKEHIKANKRRQSEFYKYTSTLDDEN